MLFLVFFIVVALLVALKGNKKFILFFMAFYPVLPDYFAIELGGGLPLLKASRILLLILMLCVCFRNKKIKLKSCWHYSTKMVKYLLHCSSAGKQQNIKLKTLKKSCWQIITEMLLLTSCRWDNKEEF